MIFKCLVIDDEELARKLIVNHLSKLDDFEIIAECESAIEASKVLQIENVDLLFLDIEMPVLRGIDFFKNLVNKPKVIFTTAYRDFALDGFDLNAVDYLLKPITFARFLTSIEKFKSQVSKQKTESPHPTETSMRPKKDYMYVRADRKQIKVLFDEILYIDSIKDYIRINTVSNENILVKSSVKSFEPLLDERFLRVHRSYIINRDKITAYTNHDIEIGKMEVPIGESYKGEVVARLK